MARKLRYIDGADFLGQELAASVENVWEEAVRFNEDVFGASRFSDEELGLPEDRISIHETEMPTRSGVEAVFTWPDGEFIAGGTAPDEDHALAYLLAAMEDEHTPHKGHQTRGEGWDHLQENPGKNLEKLQKAADKAHDKKDTFTVGTPEWEFWHRKAFGLDNEVAFEKQRREKLMRNGKSKMRRNSGLSLFANPYDTSATGFPFSSFEEFEKKYAAQYKKKRTEEYEIEFIDGDPLVQKLFKGMNVSQANLEQFFELADELESMDEGTRVGLIWLMEDRLKDVDDALADAENVNVFEGEPADYAESLIEDMGEIPEELSEMYFDYDSFGRDLRISGDDIMSTEEQIEELQDGDKDDKKEAKKLQKWVESIEEMDDDDRAREFIDGIGGLTEAVNPEQIARYFDYEAWARDMGFNGEIDTFHLDGTDYVITNASEH